MVQTVDTLCRSCELTRTRPNDDDAVGLTEFARAEPVIEKLRFVHGRVREHTRLLVG